MNHLRPVRFRRQMGFTLVELLVVIALITIILSILLPALSGGKRLAVRAKCLSNIRQIQIAQIAYAAAQDDLLIYAGDGTEQGSWLGPLQTYGAPPEARRCPADRSVYFDEPVPGSSPPLLRTTSYAINDYVSPTHAPFGFQPFQKLSQIRRSSTIIHLVELAESGAYAASDHVHVEDFYLAIAPQITIALIDMQLPLGRHGGRPQSWDAILNFSFVDGHAESLPIWKVYTDPTNNLFDPTIGR